MDALVLCSIGWQASLGLSPITRLPIGIFQVVFQTAWLFLLWLVRLLPVPGPLAGADKMNWINKPPPSWWGRMPPCWQVLDKQVESVLLTAIICPRGELEERFWIPLTLWRCESQDIQLKAFGLVVPLLFSVWSVGFQPAFILSLS